MPVTTIERALLLDHIESELHDARTYEVPTTWREYEEWRFAHEEIGARLEAEYIERQGTYDTLSEACDPRANPEANARRFLDWFGRQWRESYSN